jgi:hypothetical protein
LRSGGWSTSCLALGHLAVTWLLQNAVPGVRQALLTVQTDDVFLTTGEQRAVRRWTGLWPQGPEWGDWCLCTFAAPASQPAVLH